MGQEGETKGEDRLESQKRVIAVVVRFGRRGRNCFTTGPIWQAEVQPGIEAIFGNDGPSAADKTMF